MIKIKINFKILGIYFFILTIMFLAGMSMSGVLRYLFFLLLFLPLISFIKFLISFFSLKYFQNFDNEHPIKGESVEYILSLSNESYFSNISTEVDFMTIRPLGFGKIPKLKISLKGNEKFDFKYNVHCPFRGIYTVGIKEITVKDLFGYIKLFPEVWHRTFYVYPRIIDLNKPFASIMTDIESIGAYYGIKDDITLLKTLKEYRNGESIRHMSWQKFAVTGKPYIKTYDKMSYPSVNIYVDLRRIKKITYKVLESEDCTIEIMVALVKYYLKNNINVSVNAYGTEIFNFSSNNPDDFYPFHQSTININFADTISPINLYQANINTNPDMNGATIFITHILDPNILELANKNNESSSIIIILNQIGMSKNELDKSKIYIDSIKDNGSNILLVKNNNTIKEDLEL